MRADGLFEQESHNVLMYWGARQESATECARRAQRLFQSLAECDPALRHWYTRGHTTRGRPGVPVDTKVLAPLEEEMLRGRHWTDRNKRVIEELGFLTHFWNEETPALQITITCGAYTSTPNSCILMLRGGGTTSPRLLNVPMLARLMTIMVEAWDVDHGLVSTNNYTLLIGRKDSGPVGAGWLTYVSRRQGEVPPMPDGVRIESLGEHGTLLVLPVEGFTADNAEHVALAGQVRQRLMNAGLLELRQR
ncbi:hypothetical protein HPC49_53010 [Pyxidicoccus fallax]|uniref:Immunity protein 52 domain-containing protein n=1 Tax=Pyxidicoccus fallax TaxID=394095 RepID=A0A848M0X0_9BACT|nr:Imm52 family immunity protein [Pyxidicoccus fallax]NMO23480.1 hypothetical protein [Pyxidicoccus fallax]NPC86892.1 hypothetical protein [Pyxidicoccus fallax]